MRVWIDATDPRSTLQVFGMTLLERQLHTISTAGLTPTEVCISLPPDAATVPSLPGEVAQKFPLRWVRERSPLREQLTRAVRDADGEPLLALEADSVIDARLLQYMAAHPGSLAAQGGEGDERAAVLRLEGPVAITGSTTARLSELATAGIAQETIKELPLKEVPDYIRKLRRHLPVYLFRVTDPISRDRAERFLFWSNYKGSTDFFTKYVYPPLVWRMVRPLARWRVHPNVVTLFNVVITLAAVPLFAWEYWVTGFVFAYTMSVLDSVDGKLARLTFTSSRLGNFLDHGLDIIHPPLWYLGWAWALSNGAVASPVFQAFIWMTVAYALDRIIAGVFKRRTNRSIHGYTPLDERMRTFISRRNINLPIFTVGLIAGVPVPAFMLIVLWQGVTFLFHLERLIRFWNGKATQEVAG